MFGIDDALIGAGITGVLGYMGQQDTNDSNRQIAENASAQSAANAQKQMDFQERMSNTSYQRGVKDMEAAGLNPMLAYSQGGASSPTGAMGQTFTAQMGNKTLAGLQSGAQVYQNMNTRADTELKKSQALVNEVEARKKEQDIHQSIASAGHLDAMKDKVRQDMQRFTKEMEKLGWETESAKFNANIRSNDMVESMARVNYASPRAIAERDQMQHQAQRLKMQAELLGLDIPEAVAYASFYKSAAGKAKPYTDYGTESLGRLVGSAAQARRAFGGR